MTKSWALMLVISFGLVGCAGLRQFPEEPPQNDHARALDELDKEYATTLDKIYAATGDNAAKDRMDIRNRFIERRIAVIDAYYKEFQAGLVKENVRADFLISVIGIGVGAAGSLVAETASQILSAVSGGLAGAQAAYGKAVLYDKAMSALVAQMQASRKAVKVQILERWAFDAEKYPLWIARTDLEAYAFAGSLPGAILATAADAKVKEGDADKALLRAITPFAVSDEAFDKKQSLEADIDKLTVAKAQAALEKVRAEFRNEPDVGKLVAQYTPDVRERDKDGAKAKVLLKRLVSFTVKTADDLRRWEKIVAP